MWDVQDQGRKTALHRTFFSFATLINIQLNQAELVMFNEPPRLADSTHVFLLNS